MSINRTTISSSSVIETHATADGSIEPITDFLLTPPPEVIYNVAKKVVRSIVGDVGFLKDQRPNALVLTANVDFNGAFNLTIFRPTLLQAKYSLINIFFHKEIERLYNTVYKRVYDVKSLCRAIDIEHARGKAADLLVIAAHGEQESMTLNHLAGHFEKLSIEDTLPTDSCFHNLSSNATILIQSCSTGRGREAVQNLANHVARSSPEDARIFSATRPTTHVKIIQENPI